MLPIHKRRSNQRNSNKLGSKPTIVRQLYRYIFQQPVEHILHPSTWRLRWLGLLTLTGHPLFYWIWSSWLPQPWESLGLRLVIASLGLVLLIPAVNRDPSARRTQWLFSLVFWLQLPWFFTWMYWCNNGNPVWLASVSAIVLFYFHITDWRIATLGSVSGAIVAWLMYALLMPDSAGISDSDAAVNSVVIAFSLTAAILLGFSSANLRREHVRRTLVTVGVMAHELRTPLASVAMMAQGLRHLTAQIQDPAASLRALELTSRMRDLVRDMNAHINMQVANAGLLNLPLMREPVPVGFVIKEALRDYPFRTASERDCVELAIEQDFFFEGSHNHFRTVINNLLKNALFALAEAGTTRRPGDIQIHVQRSGGHGRITFTDRGIGMTPEVMKRIFEPFFSTKSGMGHGLGLSYSKKVIELAQGRLSVQSRHNYGTVFTIDLPASTT